MAQYLPKEDGFPSSITNLHVKNHQNASRATGLHVAYINVQSRYGAPLAMDQMDAFYAHLTSQSGLSPKTVLEGFSRDGLANCRIKFERDRNPYGLTACFGIQPEAVFPRCPKKKAGKCQPPSEHAPASLSAGD